VTLNFELLTSKWALCIHVSPKTKFDAESPFVTKATFVPKTPFIPEPASHQSFIAEPPLITEPPFFFFLHVLDFDLETWVLVLVLMRDLETRPLSLLSKLGSLSILEVQLPVFVLKTCVLVPDFVLETWVCVLVLATQSLVLDLYTFVPALILVLNETACTQR